MKRFALTLLVLAGISAGSAKADMFDFVNSNKNGDGITEFKDEDFEELVGDSDSIIEVGEFILGIFEFEEMGPAGATVGVAPDGSSLVGFSLLRVAAIDTLPDISPLPGLQPGFLLTFIAPTLADWTAITTAFGVPVTPTTEGTMFALYDELPVSTFSGDGTVPDGLGSIDTTDPALEFGFTGAFIPGVGTLGAANEFFAAISTSLDVDLIVGALANTFGGNLSVTANFDPNLVFTPHDFNGIGAAADVQVVGGFLTADSGSTDFDIKTNSQFYVDATVVPEPTTFVVWAALFGGAAGIRRIRGRKDEQLVA